MNDFPSKINRPKDCNCVFKNIIEEDDFEQFSKNKNIVNFYKGETIFKQGAFNSHIGSIISGYAKIYIEGVNGKQQVLYLSNNQDLIGHISLFYDNSSIASVSALTDTTVCLINHETIKYFLTKAPAMSSLIISNINKHNHIIFNRIISLTQKQMHGRVADTLLYLSKLLNDSAEIDLPLTRKELAELSGMTTESFIRILTEYKNDGIVVLNGKKIEIKSFPLIAKLSQIG